MTEQRKAATAAPITEGKGMNFSLHLQGNGDEIAAANMAAFMDACNSDMIVGGDTLTQKEDDYVVSLHEAVTLPTFLLDFLGVGLLPLGNIVVVKGKKKSAKTKFIQMLCAVALGAAWGDVVCRNIVNCLLYFDTEMDRYDTIGILRNIVQLCGWSDENPDRLRVSHLRSMGYEQRRAYISEQVERYRPKLVVVDGIADIEPDFNDLQKSSDVVQWLMSLTDTYKCCAIVVLHENKSKDDSNTQGHLGNVLAKKMYNCFQVKRDGSAFTVQDTEESRGKEIDTLRFTLDNDGIARPTTAPGNSSEPKFIEEIKRVLPDVFKTTEAIGRNELERKYSVRAACSERTASSRIKLALDKGLLYVGSDEKYHISQVGQSGAKVGQIAPPAAM